jgi:hypothetical protein
MDTKRFKVAARSANRNSFGLRGSLLIASDGEAWEVGFSYNNEPGVLGDTIDVPVVDDGETTSVTWARVGGEIPRRLPPAPASVIRELWGKEAA